MLYGLVAYDQLDELVVPYDTFENEIEKEDVEEEEVYGIVEYEDVEDNGIAYGTVEKDELDDEDGITGDDEGNEGVPKK